MEVLQGNTVTCEKNFTSYALAEELLKRKTALVCTNRMNKPELPPQLQQTKQRALLSSLFAFKKTHTVVSYVPKRGKNVLLLSTKHREPAVSDTEKKKASDHHRPQPLQRCRQPGQGMCNYASVTHAFILTA